MHTQFLVVINSFIRLADMCRICGLLNFLNFDRRVIFCNKIVVPFNGEIYQSITIYLNLSILILKFGCIIKFDIIQYTFTRLAK